MSELFATTGECVAHIRQQGDTWHTTIHLKDSRAQCLALDKCHPGTIYVGAQGKGAWKSRDNGQTWLDKELPQEDVFSIALVSVPGHLFAGLNDGCIYVSHDMGGS